MADVRAWQSHFEKEANLTQEAVTNYSSLFADGYRSDGHFTEYIHLLTAQRRDDEALSAVEKYLSKGDSVAARVLQAEVFSSKKEFAKARTLLKEQHEHVPFNLQVSRALALARRQGGRRRRNWERRSAGSECGNPVHKGLNHVLHGGTGDAGLHIVEREDRPV